MRNKNKEKIKENYIENNVEKIMDEMKREAFAYSVA